MLPLKDWQPTSVSATDDTLLAGDSQGDFEGDDVTSSDPSPKANEPTALGDAPDSLMEYQLNQLEEHLPEHALPGPDRPQIPSPKPAASAKDMKPCEPPARPVSTPCRVTMKSSQDCFSLWVGKTPCYSSCKLKITNTYIYIHIYIGKRHSLQSLQDVMICMPVRRPCMSDIGACMIFKCLHCPISPRIKIRCP